MPSEGLDSSVVHNVFCNVPFGGSDPQVFGLGRDFIVYPSLRAACGGVGLGVLAAGLLGHIPETSGGIMVLLTATAAGAGWGAKVGAYLSAGLPMILDAFGMAKKSATARRRGLPVRAVVGAVVGGLFCLGLAYSGAHMVVRGYECAYAPSAACPSSVAPGKPAYRAAAYTR